MSNTTTLPISEIKVGERFRKDMGEIDALAKSIKDLGLLQPVVVTMEHELIAGARRIEACKLLGLTEILVNIIDMEHIALGEQDENEMLKEFTTSERTLIGKKIEKLIGDRRGSNQHQVKELPQDFADAAEGKETREIAARGAGFGNTETYRQAKKVTEDGAPELIEVMDQKQVSISAAAEVASLPLEEQQDLVKQGPKALTAKAKKQRDARNKKAKEKYAAKKQAKEAKEREETERQIAEQKAITNDLAERMVAKAASGELKTVLPAASRVSDYGQTEFVMGWFFAKCNRREWSEALALYEKINRSMLEECLREAARKAAKGDGNDAEAASEPEAETIAA